MQPDSLVFLLIVGLWAVFFLQFWVRRREHLATAHAADTFTETMRVLDRTPADRATPTRSSYAVALTARPQGSAQARVAVPGRAEATPRGERSRDVTTDRPEEQFVTSRPAAEGMAGGTGERRRAGSAGAARVRGLLLLATLLAVPVVAVLAQLGTLGWAWVAAPAGLLVLTLGWLRRSAKVASSRRAVVPRSATPARQSLRTQPGQGTAERAKTPAPRTATRAPRTAAPEPARTVAPAPSRESLRAEPGDGTAERAKSAPGTAPAASAYDPFAAPDTQPADTKLADTDPAASTAPEPAVAEVAAPEPEPEVVYEMKVLVDEDDIPLTWDPVPVPRPVYTMKERATRPEPQPAETTPTPARPRNHEATAYAGQPKRSAHTA